MKENYFRSLTGLRFIAATMVFFLHFNPLNKSNLIGGMINEFHIGVTIFFVLSGFLISYRYNDKVINYRSYFVNRFSRIYPVFFLFTVITYVLHPTKNYIELILNFTLLKAFFSKFLFTGIDQAWTLTVEEFFYVFVLILFYLRKKNKIVWICITPILLLILGLFLQFIFSNYSLCGFLDTTDLVINITFFGRSFEFIAGFLLGIYIHKLNFNFKYFTLFGICIIILSSISLYIAGIDTLSGKIVNNYLLPSFGIIPLIYGLVKEKTFIASFLELNVIEFLGKSSYAFYIIHLGVVSDFLFGITDHVLLVYIILLLFSCVVFKYIEEPMNIYMKKLFSR